MATIPSTAAASTGTSSTRIRLVPFFRRRTSCTATPARTATLSVWVKGRRTASTKPGSELGTINALGGQSVPQLAHGFGVGKSPRRASSRNIPTVSTPALNSSRSARVASRPDGNTRTT